VAREIDESVRQSLNRGAKDLWVRLTDVVMHMVDKLNEPESRFHASLVTLPPHRTLRRSCRRWTSPARS